MRKTLACLIAALAISITVAAQEYGRPDELKGLKRVFIDAGTDFKNRERIVKELEKSKIDFEILDSAEGAEVVLSFNSGKESRVTGVATNPQGTFSTPVWRKIATGEGVVFVMREGRARAVLSHEDEQNSGWERKPATNFAREFLKAYRRANNLK